MQASVAVDHCVIDLTGLLGKPFQNTGVKANFRSRVVVWRFGSFLFRVLEDSHTTFDRVPRQKMRTIERHQNS